MVWFAGGGSCQQMAYKCNFWGNQFQKFNFECFLLNLLICLPKTPTYYTLSCVSFVHLVTYEDFRDLNIFHPFFGLKLQIMTLFFCCCWKSEFLCYCSFKKLFQKQPKLQLQCWKQPRHVLVFKIVVLNFGNHHFTHIAVSLCPSGIHTSSYLSNNKYFIQHTWNP